MGMTNTTAATPNHPTPSAELVALTGKLGEMFLTSIAFATDRTIAGGPVYTAAAALLRVAVVEAYGEALADRIIELHADCNEAPSYCAEVALREATEVALDTWRAQLGIEFCEWFAGCTNLAEQLTPHPILGKVPTCPRCHKFATVR